MLQGSRIVDKALRRFWEQGDDSKINAKWRRKVWRILNALNVAVSPYELGVPGLGFHELKGDRKGTYAVWVTRNWRVTFKWDEQGPYNVEMEDYHGC
jgi:proteic killer suppression protein